MKKNQEIPKETEVSKVIETTIENNLKPTITKRIEELNKERAVMEQRLKEAETVRNNVIIYINSIDFAIKELTSLKEMIK